MNYVLTQEEYNALRGQNSEQAKLTASRLQRVCTLAANHVPISLRWGPRSEEPSPWGCIMTPGSRQHYCDECPVTNECPNPNKQWSK